jgi:hypothetical protein
MTLRALILRAGFGLGLAALAGAPLVAQAPKAPAPVLITSCGQSPDAATMNIMLRSANVEHLMKEDATAQDLAGGKFKSIMIVTGTSGKGMGAAGVTIDEELSRTKALVAQARKLNIPVVGVHIGGKNRRGGAVAGDNSDELSIDAVCLNAQLLLVRKEGDYDQRFTKIAASKKIPLLLFEKNVPELKDLLTNTFAK